MFFEFVNVWISKNFLSLFVDEISEMHLGTKNMTLVHRDLHHSEVR